MAKSALITGVTGQDGSYLAELLLNKGYNVYGLVRRSSSFNRQRIEHIYSHANPKSNNFFLIYGDITDSTSLINAIAKSDPDEIYHLAAQSHVHVSFDVPEYTANADAVGTLRLLEAIRLSDKKKILNFTMLPQVNYTVKFMKFPKMRKHHFIQEVLME